jgi:hypothetical protein
VLAPDDSLTIPEITSAPTASKSTGARYPFVLKQTAASVALQYPDATFTLTVGAINPVDDTTEAGWRARLFNLGFRWEPTGVRS